MRIIYKPIGFVFGVIGALIGRQLFDRLWAKIDEEHAPESTTQETTWPKVLMAAAIQGLIFRTVRVVVERYGAIGWHYVTGFWPGEKRPKPED